MRKALFCSVFFLVCAVAVTATAEEKIRTGDSRERVISILGRPKGRMKWGNEEILTYDAGEVTLVDGEVTHFNLLLDEGLERRRARQAEKEAGRKEAAGRKRVEKGPPIKKRDIAREKISPAVAFDFDRVDIDNVPVAPFLSEVGNKIDISQHPTYRNMPSIGGHKHIVDPFYFKRDSGRVPNHSFRQFTTSQSIPKIIKWYKEKATPESHEIGSDFEAGGGFFSNGPFDGSAMNLGTNNVRNFIFISAMKGEGGEETIVYIFHYRKD